MSKERTRQVVVCLFVAALAMAPQATRADGGDLWIRPVGDLGPIPDTSRLVSYSVDVDLFILPPESAAPGSWTPLGAVDDSGEYYLYLVQDAGVAQFLPPSRVLFRQGRTAVLWTPAVTPRLTPESEKALHGLRQPVLVTMTPKPRPAREGAAGDGTRATSFHPLVAGIAAEVSEAAYTAVWQILDDFETRYTSAPENLAAAQWMRDLMASYGLEAELFEYQFNGPKWNVIATLPGAVDPSKVVYLTGHFDSISEDPWNHAAGADDNGSGSAAFLEAARVLSAHEFAYTIKLVGFSGEEQGLKGSFAYVEHILQQGEDVLGCYNLDMVAYRGEDPDPPDVIIYTNPASAGLAQVFRDACNTFAPGDLQPVILNEALGASDHAAFWYYGYDAILAIEDEAWGNDFCPWYHTSNDRIENYPTDYPTHVTKAAVAAVAQTAIPQEPLSSAPPAAGIGGFRLQGPWPNPSSSRVALRLEVGEPSQILAIVFAPSGRRVRTLRCGELAEGTHEISWDGKNDNGHKVRAGVYLLRVEALDQALSARLIRVD